jgi:hypothetical protein
VHIQNDSSKDVAAVKVKLMRQVKVAAKGMRKEQVIEVTKVLHSLLCVLQIAICKGSPYEVRWRDEERNKRFYASIPIGS